MRLDKVITERFLTYEQEEYIIPNRPLQVQGRNLTEEDQESNGSGKSGLFTAIEFCITASNSRDVRDAELVMFGQSDARVQLFASCDMRKETIHIDWTIKVKGSNKLTLMKKSYKGEWEEVSFSNVNDGKKYIMSWFDISRDDLFNYYIINKTRFKSFFKASQKEKVDLINRFSDASIIDGLEKIDNSHLQDEYDTMKSNASKLEGKIELVEANIEKEKTRDFEAEYREEVEDINDEIDSISSKIETVRGSVKEAKEEVEECNEDDIKLEGEIKTLEKELKPIQSKIDEANEFVESIKREVEEAKVLVDGFITTDWSTKRSSFEEEIEEVEEKIEEVEAKKDKQSEQETKILSFLQSIEVKLKGSITCPKCSHQFILDGDIDELKTKQNQGLGLKTKLERAREQVSASHAALKEDLASIESQVSSINKEEELENAEKNKLQQAVNAIQTTLNTKLDEIRGYEGQLKSINTKIDKKRDSIKENALEVKDIETEIKGFETEIKNFNTEIGQYKSQLESLKKGNNKSILKEYRVELKSLENDLKILNGDIEVKGDEIYLRNQWANNFKQFRMHLANQSLEAIEFHCNRYLSGMGSDLKVKFEGYRMLANGQIKDEITAKIIRNVERTFSSFSGGEQGRLLFAAILANRHMINQTHKYGGLDFLSVDEVFEGVDSLGLRSLIKAAKQLEVAVMIITHVTDEEVSEDTLLIEKTNGISKIKR